jgi:O-antigen/teichoic acid export membrane protein
MKHPAQEGLLRHGLFLLVATQVANACNLLFHVVMGRTLPAHEYAILATMLQVMLIIGTPLEALRTAVAHFSAHAGREGFPGDVMRLLAVWCVRMAWVAAPLVVAGCAFSPQLSRFFHLEVALPVVLAALATAAIVYVPLLAGALQGLQAFVWMALSLHTMSIVRLLLGWALVRAGFLTASSGVASHGAGIFMAIAFGAWGLATLTRRAPRSTQPLEGVGGYFLQSLLMLGAFAVLMNVDVVLVRHYLPEDSGAFARAATIGRAIIFLPMPIALALFPKVISKGEMSGTSRALLVKAFLLVGLIIASGVVACTLFPKIPLTIMYKDTSDEAARLVRLVVWAMAPLGMTYLLVNFEMAQRRFKSTPHLCVLAAAYLTGVAFFHANVLQIIAVLAVVSTLSAAALIARLVRHPAEAAGERGMVDG